MSDSESSRDIVIAQCQSFADKMPAFYGSVVACMIAQMIVFSQENVHAFFLGAPLLIAAVAISRMYWWIKRRKSPFTYEEARRSLAQARYILSASTLTIIAIDVVAYALVSDAAKAFLTYLVFGCVMTGVYCMMQVRVIAYVMIAGLLLALCGTIYALPPQVAAGVAIATLALTATMVATMVGYYDDFMSMMKASEAARKLSDENLRLANIDMLTDLPNRRQFFRDLDSLCAGADGGRIAVAIADLDGFKPINDTHGHVVGDRVLRIVAGRIAQAPEFQAYRLAGDEFALIARGARSDEALVEAARALIAHVTQPIESGELLVAAGCSVGVATFPDMAPTPELLYERADYALYHAKRSGRNTALLFSRQHEEQLRARGEVEQALRNANIDAEFYLVFQPIVASATGAPTGFECLARWRSPIIGDVSPGLFIPIAEQSGLIANLTPMLLRKALAEAGSWPAGLRLSFNLSPHDVASRERTLAIIAIIARSGFDPRRLDLELTETALVQSFEQTCENMELLKATGASISLDDFGTGYSSLSHIHMLPLDKVKIDRSFVTNLEAGESARTIVRSVVTLCRDLNITCIVEGVETLDQLGVLNDLGCRQAQGFYFARPMRSAEVAAWLAARAPSDAPVEAAPHAA